MLCTLLAPTGGRATVAGYDVATDPGAVRLRIGAALQDVALDPKQTGTELLRLQGRLYGLPARAIDRRVDQLGELIDLGDALDQPHQHLLRRHAAPPRPRRRARAQPGGPVPRRAHDRSRPGQPGPGVGRGPPAQRGARHDDLPHDAVPRGGRRARRPGRHHRPRPHGRRRHARRPQALGRRRPHRRPCRRRRPGRSCRRSTRSQACQSVEAHGDELVIATDNGSGRHQPGRRRARRRARCRYASSRCARRRSTTCSSTSRARASTTTTEEAVMTATIDPITIPVADHDVRARPAGFVHDLTSIAGRALRAVPRDIEAVMPPVFIALFFFVVNIATLQRLTEATPGFDYTAFQMATAILLGVTGVSRAGALVLDVQRRLLRPAAAHARSPHRHPARSHGRRRRRGRRAHGPDHHRSGSSSASASTGGPIGILVFIALASLWSLAFAGFGYAIALKTGNPAAVNVELPAVLPVPVPHVVVRAPQPALRLARHRRRAQPRDVHPRRAALTRARRRLAVGRARRRRCVAIAVVGAVSMAMCFAALRGRVKRG